MGMISFSGETSRGPFWKLILSGEKMQTVRRPRKRTIKTGELLHLYWKVRVAPTIKPIHKIGTAVCIEVVRMKYSDFYCDDEFARADGFRDSHELREWFEGSPLTRQYDVIRWRHLIPTMSKKLARANSVEVCE